MLFVAFKIRPSLAKYSASHPPPAISRRSLGVFEPQLLITL